MEHHVPDSYEYHLLKYTDAGDHGDVRHLEKAYAIDPDRPDAYYSYIVYHKVHRQIEEQNSYLQKLYESRDVAPGLLSYAYNVLMSVAPKGILLTSGDNDTYPVWVLQTVKGVRPDVTVLNSSLIRTSAEYLQHKLAEKGVSLDLGQLPSFPQPDCAVELIRYFGKTAPQVPVHIGLTAPASLTAPLLDHLFIVGLTYPPQPGADR